MEDADNADIDVVNEELLFVVVCFDIVEMVVFFYKEIGVFNF